MPHSGRERPLRIRWNALCDLGAPPDVVFAFVADHSALPSWIPGLRRVDIDCSRAVTTGRVGTRRTLHMFAGSTGTEIVTEFEPARRLVYSATDESLRGLLTEHCAELRCEGNDGSTRFSWVVSGRQSGIWWKRLIAKMIFGAVIRFGVRNLQRRFPLLTSARSSGAAQSVRRTGHAPHARLDAVRGA